MNRTLIVALSASLTSLASAQVTVTSFAPANNTTFGVWYESDIRDGGAAATADLTDLGGNLENLAPLAGGAALLTTGFANGDKAEVGVADAYGLAGNILSTLNVTYSYYKQDNPGGNVFAAPALKLIFFNPVCDDPGSMGDCFGTLTYEPYWNQPGMAGLSSFPILEQWTTVNIDANNGVFWWSGGFGQPSGAGGPPLRTLAQWQTFFNSDFADASLVQVGLGVGTFNQGQIGYFDNVLISHGFGGGYSAAYDFEVPPQFNTTQFPVGAAPCDVALKDLTGDNNADVATADSGSDSVTILTNDGSGGFSTSTTVNLTAGDIPTALAAGEIILGGGCDLAVALRGGDAVVLIDNAPTGTFTPSTLLSTLPATEPVGIAVDDLDGVGSDDIVVVCQGDLLVTGTSSVLLSLNGGPFAPLPAPVGGFLRPQNVEICDLDGDGDNDAIVTMAGNAFASLTNNVLLYTNLGGGVFAAPIALSVSQNPRGICCGDLDGDGDVDFAVTAESFPTILPGSVEVFLNTGVTPLSVGTFASGGSFSGGTSPTALACGDLRDDSIAGFCSLEDIVSVNFGSQTLTHYSGYDAGTTSFASQRSESADLVPVALAIANLNGDKTLDMVVANKASNNVSVLLAITPSLAKAFGTGCVGSNGTPEISATGSPSFGNNNFGVSVSNARPFAPTLLGVSLNQFTTPLGGGCDLYLVPPLVLISTVTNGSGEATVTLTIPGALSGFAGCDAFFQYFVFDPNGAFNGQFAFSDALRIKVGN